MRQWRCWLQGHAGPFSMDSNGDKLASYSILALNHSAAAFNTAWTLRTQFIGNCSEEDHHCPLETTFTPSVQIVWPGSCWDRIYRAVAMKRFGECFLVGGFFWHPQELFTLLCFSAFMKPSQSLLSKVSHLIWKFHTIVYDLASLKPYYSTGFCNAESVLKAPLDFPLCGFRGDLCPEPAPSSRSSTISLVTLKTIVIGVLLIDLAY